jgi:hypothetical protein
MIVGFGVYLPGNFGIYLIKKTFDIILPLFVEENAYQNQRQESLPL